MELNFSKDEFLDLLHFNVCSSYAFNTRQLELYKEVLDWTQISSNQVISWNYDIIKQFESYLDWDFLKKNKKVNEVITLGLLFPHRVELPKCHCSFQYDFCECDNSKWHSGDWERGFVKGDNFSPRGHSEADWVIQKIVNSMDKAMLADVLLRGYVDNNLLIQNNIHLTE